MSVETFGRNLRYLKKRKGLTQKEIVAAVNKVLQKEFKSSQDKEINMKRLGSYLEGRCYCPSYILPVLCKIFGHRDPMSLFTKELEAEESAAA